MARTAAIAPRLTSLANCSICVGVSPVYANMPIYKATVNFRVLDHSVSRILYL